MSVDFSVVIPTYNGASHLPELLEQLRSQVCPENLSWEVIVVDNNSTDDTAQVVRDYQAKWLSDSPLKYVLEKQQGAAFARQRGIEEARGKLVGCLDDDNLPTPNWVAAACAFAQAHPQAGAYGSQIHGKFEVKPPEYIKSIGTYLAIIERGSKPRLYEPEKKMLPPGAGLVLRKQAWEQEVPKSLFLNHQGRGAGLASEDLEVVLHIQNAGWEIWYNPEMEIEHKIPPWRLEKDYLVSLVRCVGLSRHYIRMLRLANWQRPFITPLYILNDLRQLVAYWLKQPKEQKHEVVVACEQQLLLSILISPFFLWKKRYLDWLEHKS
ncbi:MAG: glycosyltransferase family 2 protein [Symploca sp. SIO2E9]|nr:glycosyltransferase family 2 protein [Symploca sp. SIO2E9]